LPEALLKDTTIVELDRMIESWNTGALILPPKETLRKMLDNRLSARVTSKIYAYETAVWRDGLMRQFEALPEKVSPDNVKIAGPAAQVLRLLLAKGVTRVKEAIKPELELSLFLILGPAKRSARDSIDAELMLNSVVAWWTGVWPFCD
jgi:hypothetical protein